MRYSDFTTITRSDTRTPPTADADEIARRAVALIERTDAGARPVRLLGAGVHNITSAGETAPSPEPGAATESAPRNARSEGTARAPTPGAPAPARERLRDGSAGAAKRPGPEGGRV